MEILKEKYKLSGDAIQPDLVKALFSQLYDTMSSNPYCDTDHKGFVVAGLDKIHAAAVSVMLMYCCVPHTVVDTNDEKLYSWYVGEYPQEFKGKLRAYLRVYGIWRMC